MKLDHLGLTLDLQQLWMLPNMDAPTPAYLVHKACAIYQYMERNRARLLHEMSPADCRRRQHVVAVSCQRLHLPCVCVCTITMIKSNKCVYRHCALRSLVRPHTFFVRFRIRLRAGARTATRRSRTRRRRRGRRYFVRVSFSARPLAPRRRASRSSGGDARRHARNNGTELCAGFS